MRILLVEFTSAVSGGQRSMLELVQGLRDEHEVLLACPNGPLADGAARLGIAVITIPASQLTFRLHPRHTPRGVLDMTRGALAVRRIVRTQRPDVVHANSIRAGLLAIPAALGRTPVVVHCRDALPSGLVGDAVRTAVLAGADHVVAISRHVALTFASTGWLDARVTVVHNGVGLARFDPAAPAAGDARSTLGVGGGVVLSVIAQITPWKGQDLAIQTVSELRQRGHDALLLVVGEAKFVGAATRLDNRGFERELHALVDAMHQGDHVRFLGERADPELILAASDVLLVPSTEEPFGRTIIEAMAMGVPVAATSRGGPPEILGDGVGGRLVDGRDPAAWANAVEELMAWAPERRAAARDAAAARFSRERHASSMLEVYATATANAACRRRWRGGQPSTTSPQPDAALETAISLAVDRMSAEVVSALEVAGVDALLLKGPAVIDRLYDPGEHRPYVDCDLLIPAAAEPDAVAVLDALGFTPASGFGAPDPGIADQHEWHRGSDHVDLHGSLWGVRAPAATVWPALTERCDTLAVGGRRMRVLGAGGLALLLTLHVAADGPSGAKPLEDLRRGVQRLGDDAWNEAAALARSLDAVAAFGVGLRLVPDGARLLENLGIDPGFDVTIELRASGAPPLAESIERVRSEPTLRGKLRRVARALLPTPTYMRRWTPLGSQGTAGLIVAYAWRPVWLLLQIGPGIWAWRRAHRRRREHPC